MNNLLNTFGRVSSTLLGFDVFCLNKKFLVLNLVDRNLKIKYRRSFLGYFWTMLSPIAMATIYYFVFKIVLKVEREHYLAFIISGVLPWAFFVQSISESTESVVGNASLITKIPIPIHVFPYVTSITNFSTLIFSLPVIFGAAWISGLVLTLNSLWIFFFLFALLLVSYALGSILSILFVYLRDLRHAITLIIQLWFYATPVLYESSMIPDRYKWLLYINPIGCIFDGIHMTFVGGQKPTETILAVSIGWIVFLFACLRVVHAKLRPGLVERI